MVRWDERRLDDRHPVDVEQEPPDRRRRPWRRTDRFANDESRRRGAPLEAEMRPVDRVPLRLAVQLERDEAARRVLLVLLLAQVALLPPRLVPRCHPGP